MPVSPWFRGRGLLFFALLIGRLHAQSGSLILAPASATPGAVVAVNLSLISSTTSPAGLQWTLNYPPSSITAVYATEGPAAISSGKSLSCASGAGSYTCLATGINSNTIPNGVVAVFSLTLSPSAQATSLSLTATLGSTLDGSAFPVSGTGAWITITTAAAPTFTPPAGNYATSQSVTLATTTAGAAIRYTTDGSTPSATVGTLYSGAITVNSTTTIRAIAYEAGMNDSSIGSATYTILQTVAAPAFNPVAGTYTTAQSVTLATTTAGAAIRYTTDGSAPSETSGTLYNGPIPIKATTTLKAIAYATGMADSLIASGTYTITPLGPSWYNVAWTSRKPVTVDHTKVSGILGLANFPMLLSVTDTDLKWTALGGRVGKADGTDILFTAGDGMTTLSHEIEAYNPNTGQLIAWVNIPLLNSTADTVVYVYFGNVSAGDQQNRRGVWDRDYGGVWHMSDNAANSTVSDSTVNGGNGTARASTNSKTEPGQIGSGLGFNGSTDFISMPNTPGVNIATNTNITMEAWVNVTTFTSPTQVLGYIIGKGYKEGAEAYFLLMENDSGVLHLKAGMNNNSAFAASWPISNWNPGEWHQVVGLWDGSSWTLYVDGVTKAQTSTGNGPLQMGLPLTLGAESISGTVAGLLACTLDEVRVSNVARSDAWIATQFRNQFSPGSFYAVGASQLAPQ